MFDRPPTPFPTHSSAFGLVAGSAVFGVVGCTVGAMGWGLLGLATGLVAAWSWFLLGLVLLYRREHQAGMALAPGADGLAACDGGDEALATPGSLA